MEITRDPETGMFWEEEEVPNKRTSYSESDILPEGAAILERAIAIKVEWDKYVDKVRKCETLNFDPGIDIQKLTGTFTETVRDIFKAKIEVK